MMLALSLAKTEVLSSTELNLTPDMVHQDSRSAHGVLMLWSSHGNGQGPSNQQCRA
jgi:hypothetical protein